jgi:hypothetical protein
VLCLRYHCCCHKNKPTQKNTTAATKQTHPKKRRSGWMTGRPVDGDCPSDGGFISSTIGLQGKLHSSGFRGQSDSGEADQTHGFKGSFIWSASFGRLHSCFTICNEYNLMDEIYI